MKPVIEPGSGHPLLIVSASGRALAASAARAGVPVVVLDLFNDLDTRANAVASACCASSRLRLHARMLLRAAARLCPPAQCAGMVYGSALESRPHLIARLAQDRTLYGNPPETVACVKDPVRFFALLDRLNIPYPEVCLRLPAERSGWLAKAVGGGGGAHIVPLTARHRASAGRYFQRRASGQSMSVLFAADGRSARVIGFNEQWSAGTSPRRPYRYGGASSHAVVSGTVRERLIGWVRQLTASLNLRGLNGLDFLLENDRPLALELNPRPTATVDLYDADVPGGLLAAHLAACRGVLPPLPAGGRARAHAIVYAHAALHVPRNLEWPAWCSDLPAAGTVVAAGAPLCTVHGDDKDGAGARRRALARCREIERLVWRQAA